MTKTLDHSGDGSPSLRDLISADAIVPMLRSRTKKQALQDLADAAARVTHISSQRIFETLLQRERLGSTGVGRGVAVPHGRMSEAQGITMLFARLEQPIVFDALDEEPVDLMVLLISPEQAGGDHLKALARVARLLRNPAITARLRSTRDKNTLYSILTEPLSQDAA